MKPIVHRDLKPSNMPWPFPSTSYDYTAAKVGGPGVSCPPREVDAAEVLRVVTGRRR